MKFSEISKWKYFDYLLAAICFFVAVLIVFVFSGIVFFGIKAPYAYDGQDSQLWYVSTQTIKETGWFWENPRIGYYGDYSAMDFPASHLVNFDNVISAILIFLTKDFFAAYNLFLLFSCGLCAFVSCLVFRKLELNRFFSVMGSLLYGTTPYILFRSIEHINLTSAFFIPLSVLLCAWCYKSNGEYLKFKKGFFSNKQNYLSIIFAFLISNNGIGYYAFFTCFFLCVTALVVLLESRSLKRIVSEIKLCVLIVFFSAINLIPVFVYQLKNGSNLGLTSRTVEDGEIYSLKIAQMFIPSNSTHGIKFLAEFISTYNSEMPLVNENQAAYLGLAGILGFILSIGYLLKGKKDSSYALFFSKLIFVGVIFSTVGGFSSLFSFVVHFVRAYNRVSIFVVFFSLFILLYTMQYLSEKNYKSDLLKRFIVDGAIILLFFCLFEQLPDWSVSLNRITDNYSEYYSDKAFVETIENTLELGAKVYQLPYHKYPEGGHYDDFEDYDMFTGYLLSENLRWSYGSTYNRAGDIRNYQVSSLGVDEMLSEIVDDGYSGIYIDTRAYSQDALVDLESDLETVLGYGPIVSDNENLVFYNLMPYISSNE